MTRPQSFKEFIKETYGRTQSTFTCVLGNNETGKTDFNLLQMEFIHDLGIANYFVSNMRSVKADFEIVFIEDFKTLESYCRMLNPDPDKKGLKKIIFFGSEIGKWAPRDQPWKNTKFIEKLQTVRKYGLSMLTDAIDRVDARVLNPRFFKGEFLKPYQTNKAFARFYNYATKEKLTFTDIPKTRIKYDTYETANFYMEPKTTEGIIPLDREHEIVRDYLKYGSFAKAGIHRQEGKRAVFKILEIYMKQFQNPEQPIIEVIENAEAIID
jgi:hypothetical protein